MTQPPPAPASRRRQLDRDTVAAFCSGDLDALARVYDHFSRAVWTVALSVLRDRFEDRIGNTTRFVVLSRARRDPDPHSGPCVTALIFQVRWWIETYVDTRRMNDKVNTAIYHALNQAKIEIPFPSVDIHYKNQSAG